MEIIIFTSVAIQRLSLSQLLTKRLNFAVEMLLRFKFYIFHFQCFVFSLRVIHISHIIIILFLTAPFGRLYHFWCTGPHRLAVVADTAMTRLRIALRQPVHRPEPCRRHYSANATLCEQSDLQDGDDNRRMRLVFILMPPCSLRERAGRCSLCPTQP